MRRAAFHVLGRVLAACLLFAAPLAQALPPVERGYVEMPDGIGLRYAVQLPDGPGPFPVLLQYQGYGAGSDPNDNGMSLLAPQLLEHGFAILGVNLRGTGCSEGSFDLFEGQWIDDAAVVIDWAATQGWSNGDVAMVGLSFPAITQMMVSPSRPAALKAAMPWSAITDLYRDVAYPGGIFNQSFAAAWTAIQKDGHQYLPDELAAGNTRCLTAIAGQNDPERIVFVEGQRHPWSDHFFYERLVPDGSLRAIDIPMLVTHAWQDEQLGSRVTVEYEQLSPERTWMIYGNGAHGFGLGTRHVVAEAEAFLLHFMKGVDNGFEQHPRVQIVHEADYVGAERWVTAHDSWPPPVRMAELYLTGDGRLDAQRPVEAGSIDYVYPLPAPSMTAAAAAEQENQTYQLPVAPGGAAAFTSAPLAHDLEILGPVRADLWLSSTATDTDIQVSLTEVRPDGQEQFVQRGWLRASHRKMDLRRSRANFPFQTHLEVDSEPLQAGKPTLLSVEIWAVGQLFRAGSSLRISVEAPLGTTGFRALQILPTPAVNTVHVGAPYLSRITLPVVAEAAAPVDFATCGTLINEPCRTSSGTVPAGALAVPAASRPAPLAARMRALGDGRFEISNTSDEPIYLRALKIDLGDVRDVTRASLNAGAGEISIDSPVARSRFEVPEIELLPGQKQAVRLDVERRRPMTAFGSWSSVAYAGDGSARPQAGAGQLLALVLLAIAVAACRSAKWRSLLVASALLVGCSGSSDISAPDGGTVGSAEYRVLDVEAVTGEGEFVGVGDLPLSI